MAESSDVSSLHFWPVAGAVSRKKISSSQDSRSSGPLQGSQGQETYAGMWVPSTLQHNTTARTVYSIQYTVNSIQYTVYIIEYTVYRIQYAVYSIQQAYRQVTSPSSCQ